MKQPTVDPGSLAGSEIEEYRSRMAAAPEGVEPVGLAALSPDAIAGIIDHTLLKPEANQDQIRRICREAAQYGFACVCVHPSWVTFCKDELAGSAVKVCTVIGFPLGANQSRVKEYETEQAIDAGAEEVDMVMSVGQLKSGDYDYVLADMAGVAQTAHEHDVIAKVILETGLLSTAEKEAACSLAKSAGLDFVKTSTGFSGGGATVEDIALMRRVVGPEMGVKAAGGIRTAEDAKRMVVAGATRIGTSAGVQIIESLSAETSAPRGDNR